jgi:hypothetical protein
VLEPKGPDVRAWLFLLVGGLLYAATVGWSAMTLPADGVPLHFAADGVADRVGPREEALTAMAVLGVLLLGLGVALVLLARHGPLTSFSFPRKAYWLAPQRRPAVRRMLATDVALVLGGTLAFLALLPVWTVIGAATPDNAVAPALIWVPLGCFCVGLLLWAVSFVRRFHRGDPEDRPA